MKRLSLMKSVSRRKAFGFLMAFAISCHVVWADGTSNLPRTIAEVELAKPQAKPNRAKPKATAKPLPNDSPGIRLAEKHMQELLPLIEHLQKRSPGQYEKAIRELDRSAKRLESLKKRDAQLFEIALEEWTTRTELQLTKAKLRVGKSAEGDQRIRDRQATLLDLQIKRLNRETELLSQRRANYEDRISQLNVQIERANELRAELERQKDEFRSGNPSQEL